LNVETDTRCKFTGVEYSLGGMYTNIMSRIATDTEKPLSKQLLLEILARNSVTYDSGYC